MPAWVMMAGISDKCGHVELPSYYPDRVEGSFFFADLVSVFAQPREAATAEAAVGSGARAGCWRGMDGWSTKTQSFIYDRTVAARRSARLPTVIIKG